MSLEELKALYLKENKGVSDCDLLRKVVAFMNNRNEHDNDNKSIDVLIYEYLKYLFDLGFI